MATWPLERHVENRGGALACVTRFRFLRGTMVKLCYSALFKTGTQAPGKDGPVNLNSVSELSFIGYFQRSSVLEMFNFFARTFANNSQLAVGARTSVKQQGYYCHLYVSPIGVTAVCFADEDYPARVAFGYLAKVCEDLAQSTGGQLPNSLEDNCLSAFQARSLVRTRSARLRSRGAHTHRARECRTSPANIAPSPAGETCGAAQAVPGPIAGGPADENHARARADEDGTARDHRSCAREGAED